MQRMETCGGTRRSPNYIYNNLFVKPNEQSEACFCSAVARKGA